MGVGRRGGDVEKKTKSILKMLKSTLEDVYTGKIKFVEISRYRICTLCKGSGSNDRNVNTRCSGCNGQGIKTVVRQISMGMITQNVPCSDCKGEGFLIKEKDKCKQCKALKSTQQKKFLEVHVDKGAPDGKRYIFSGEGDEFPEYEPGDVVVEIQIEKHKSFIRKKAYLIYQTNITLLEALIGFEVVIEHLDKRKIIIKNKVNDIIRPGEPKTVKEFGMPFFDQPFKYGNLYINFNIKFPDKVDSN